jgi:hypothetical protein
MIIKENKENPDPQAKTFCFGMHLYQIALQCRGPSFFPATVSICVSTSHRDEQNIHNLMSKSSVVYLNFFSDSSGQSPETCLIQTGFFAECKSSLFILSLLRAFAHAPSLNHSATLTIASLSHYLCTRLMKTMQMSGSSNSI